MRAYTPHHIADIRVREDMRGYSLHQPRVPGSGCRNAGRDEEVVKPSAPSGGGTVVNGLIFDAYNYACLSKQ